MHNTDMTDLLDLGGKYKYLHDVYNSYINRELSQRLVVYIFTISTGILTAACIFIFLPTSGREKKAKPQGCREYGLKGKSRLSDELKRKHASSVSKGPFKVHSIWIYPIKSCRGIELEEAEIVATGIKYDRQYSFAQLHSPFPLSVDDSKASKSAHQWRFITQREFPLLSQVHTELWIPDPQSPDYDPEALYVKTGGTILVRFPYEEDGFIGRLQSIASRIYGATPTKTFLIPFEPTQQESYSLEPFKIWKDTPLSLNMGVHLPPELKYYLGVRNPLTLFRVHTPRELFRRAPTKSELGWQPITGFADAYPLNIVGLGSLQALSDMQPAGSAPLGFLRFRGNIAMSGPCAFAEEEWTKIRVGGWVFHVCCRCVRCGVPNVDPETGVKHRNEPYRTLVSQRNVDPGSPKYGCLGMQLVPVVAGGVVRLGDEIEVLEKGEHFYIEM